MIELNEMFQSRLRMALHSSLPPFSTHHADSPVLSDMQQLSLEV